MAKVVDRWHRSRPESDTSVCAEHGKAPSGDHGQGLRWQVRWRDDDDTQRKANYARKAHADGLAARLNADAQAGIYRDPTAGRVTFKSYAEDWLASRPLAPSSRRAVRSRLANHVYPALGGVQLRKLRPSMVSAWLAGMTGAAKTRRVIYEHVMSILNAAVDDDVIGRNPATARSVVPPKLDPPAVQPWTGEQVRAARAAIADRWAILVDLMAGLGLRQSEALGLAQGDVDFLRGHVDVRRQLTSGGGRLVFAPPKGGRSRRVPLRPAVRDALAAHLADYPARPVTLPWLDPASGEPVTVDLLVTAESGRPVDYRALNDDAWWPAVKAAGLDHVRANGTHVLRHTFASVLLAQGVPITEVQMYLGHASPAITWRSYAHFVPAPEDTHGRVLRGLAAIDDLLLGTSPSARRVPPEQASDA